MLMRLLTRAILVSLVADLSAVACRRPHFVLRTAARNDFKGEVRLDSSKSPKQLDFVHAKGEHPCIAYPNRMSGTLQVSSATGSLDFHAMKVLVVENEPKAADALSLTSYCSICRCPRMMVCPRCRYTLREGED